MKQKGRASINSHDDEIKEATRWSVVVYSVSRQSAVGSRQSALATRR